jgi:serine/threonine-protein kinase
VTPKNVEERFEHFVVVRQIRKGGLGQLSLAWDDKQSRIVALKRSGARAGDAAARFRDEVQLTKKLTHPHLSRAVDAGEDWLALEWLEGQDLESILERARKFDQRVPLPIAGAILHQVLSALEYVHGSGVVHRDVSPRNVMMGYDGRAKLIDYGLALAAAQPRHTLPGVAPGTVGFLAPEQRSGKPVAASDLYSAGALLWFSVTGAPFFGDGEDGNSKEPFRDRLRSMAGDLPPSLVTFLWHALQKSPTQRFESAREMSKALELAIGTPHAPDAAVGAFVAALFPVEKRLADEEIVTIRSRFQPTRSTVVMDRAPPSKRRWLVAIAALAAMLVIGEVIWLLHLRATPLPPPPKVVNALPPPVEEKPVEKVVAPPPVAPIEAPRPVARTPKPIARTAKPAPPAPVLPPPAPRIEAARTKVGLAEVKLREADYPGAIALATEAIGLGADENAYVVRGFAELRAGHTADAERDFQHVLERDPGNGAARAGLKTAQERK